MNSDYDPKQTSNPKLKFSPLPCARKDFRAMWQKLNTTNILDFGDIQPYIAKNRSKAELHEIWTEFSTDVIAEGK